MLFLLASTWFFSLTAGASPALPPLNLREISVSGVSSGAFFAVQLQVALSRKIVGAGAVAGGPYGCAEGKFANARKCLGDPEKISTKTLLENTGAAERLGAIDPTPSLRKAKIYLFQSRADDTVKFPALAKLQDFFGAFVPKEQILTVIHDSAAHGFPALNYGNACDKPGLPWLQNCGRDGAGEILNHIYPGLKSPAAPAGELLSFSQKLYSDPGATLLPEARAYVPAYCRANSCRLHIAFHGCEMSTEFIGDQFVKFAGYNAWAEANGIVVLYPQVAKSAKNPKGCWDWFGYTGENYALKSAPQIQAVQRMLEAFLL